MKRTSLFSLLMLLPTVASAHVLWRGDFETANSTQWTKEEKVNPDRLVVASERVREGAYALRVQVDQGDRPIQASGNRNELVYVGEEYAPEVAEGAERFYAWSTLFSEDFPSERTWQVFTQWHHTGLNGSPPLEFYVLGEEMRMRAGGSAASDLWTAPLQRGIWHDFVVHVKWSSDPSVGYVELYHNGQLVVPLTYGATMYAGDGVYLKQGLYRNANIASRGVVYHDGFVVATALEDVLPQQLASAPYTATVAATATEGVPAPGVPGVEAQALEAQGEPAAGAQSGY